MSDNGEPCILYGELYTTYKSEVISEIVSKTNIDATKLVRSKVNDVIIPCSGETAEDIATARCVPFDNILLGGDLNIIRLHDINGSFMSYQLNGKRKYDIAKVAQGVSVVHLYGEHLKGIKTYSPGLEEQTKIAKLLSLLDERIATQSRAIEKLQSLIRGISNKLLYDKSWRKVYLKDMLSFYSTNSLSWDSLTKERETEIKNLHYGIIHNSTSSYIDADKLPWIKTGNIPTTYELCQDGDIAFADASEDTAEIAKAIEFRNAYGTNAICGLHTIHGRDTHNMTVKGFKGYAFNTYYFHRQIRQMAQGTKVFSISANNISNCYIYVPDKNTQKHIVCILDSYMLKMQIENKLLDHYMKQKQYLLRQMFI